MIKTIMVVCLLALSCGIGGACAQTLAQEALNKGMGHLTAGKYDEAIAEFSRVIDSDPRNAQAYYGRAQAYHKKQKLGKAIADYSKVIELDPKNAEANYNRGIAYYYRDELDLAIADWTRTIEISGEYAQAYQKRAFAYLKKQEYDKAWDDVAAVKKLGYGVDANFLEQLKGASGRQE